MPDIATISAFLGSIKTAVDLTKALRDADNSLEKAELKLKIAELTSALADIKLNAIEIGDIISEKDKQINQLESALANKDKLIRSNGKYYEPDENNKPTGDPYCSHCWESKGKAIHLSWRGGAYACPSCGDMVLD